MSNEALTWAFKQELPMVQKFVLVALADYADEDGSCFPAHAKTAKRVGASVRTTQRAVRELADAGYIVIQTGTRGNGSQTSNRYRLNVGSTPTPGVTDSQGGVTESHGGGDRLSPGGVTENTPGGVPPVSPPEPSIEPPDEPSDEPAPASRSRRGDEVAETEEPHPAHLIAQRAYDATHGALKFIAVRQVAQWAIDKRGANPDRVEHAIADIHHRGKPVTRAVVDQWLDGAFDRKPHWQMSSDDRAAAALEQMRGAMTPTEDLMDRALEEGR